MSEFFDFRPDLSTSTTLLTPEPSLKEILYNYYKVHFPEHESRIFTDLYLRQYHQELKYEKASYALDVLHDSSIRKEAWDVCEQRNTSFHKL